MEQLSPVDSGFLATETAAAPGHIGWITVLEPGPEGPLCFGAVQRIVAERLQLVPGLRRRLAPVPFGLDRPYWVEGRVLDVGDSPKTECLWWDATTTDDKGREVVRMRHLLRFLKASSPLYPDLQLT